MSKEGFLYNAWNELKKSIQAGDDNTNLYFKDQEVWWCHVGLRIGKEVYGKGRGFTRPVLILKKLSSDLAVVLPITSQKKQGTWFVDFSVEGVQRCAMLYQIFTVDKKRFQRRIGVVAEENFVAVKEKLKVLLELL